MVTTYRDWQVGDVINICTSITEFCGSLGNNFIRVYDINVTKSPDSCNPSLGTGGSCGLHLDNVELTFSLIKGSDGANCSVAQKYKTIGSVRTNSSGVARIVHVITEQDRLNYIAAINEGYLYRIMACITNSDGQTISTNISEVTDSITIGQNLCYGIICSDVCIGNDLYYQACNPTNGQCIQGTLKEANSLTCQSTHYIDIKIKAHSWYTPGGAADWIVTKVADINGSLVNLFSGITDYQYLGVTIFTDAGHVIIRAHLKQLSTASLAAPLLAEIAAIVAMIFYIVVVVGIIVGVYLITSTIQRVFGKDYTKSEVGGLLNDILQRNLENCDNNFPNDPVGYANCVKSGIQSVTGAGGDFFDDPVITQSGDTAATTIDACTAQYNIDHDTAKLATCVNTANGGVQDTIGKETCKDGIWNPTAKKCEKAIDWGKILLYGVIFVGGIVIVTRK